MQRSLVVCTTAATLLTGAGDAFAQRGSESDRLRAIEQMERELQSRARANRVPLSRKPTHPTSRSRSSSSSSKSSGGGLLGRLFGGHKKNSGNSSSSTNRDLRPVSGNHGRSSRSSTSTRSSNSAANDSGDLSAEGPKGPPVEERREYPPSNLKSLVGSILNRMGPMPRSGSDEGVMNAGSYSFEDYVYEQRRRDGDFETGGGEGNGREEIDSSGERLQRLLAGREPDSKRQIGRGDGSSGRNSSTELLALADESGEMKSSPEREAARPALEKRVREQKRRLEELAAKVEEAEMTEEGNESADRLLELLASERPQESSKIGSEEVARARDSSTALLGAGGMQPAPEETVASAGDASGASGPTEEEVEAARERVGQSSTYRTAVAKLETYEKPTPPPLRAVSGFQGLMRAKPSDQSVKNSREGTLSALRLE